MKPLNRKERNRAFYKVVGLFLLSFLIAVIVGFSTMNVSRLSDRNTQNELEDLKNNLRFQKEVFAPNVGNATGLLLKIPTCKDEGENLGVLNKDIETLLSNTNNKIIEDESWESKMYQDVTEALSALQLAYNKQIELLEDLGDSNKSSQKLKDLKSDNAQLQNQLSSLQDLKMQNAQLQSQINSLQSGGGGAGTDCTQIEEELKATQGKLKLCNGENKALKSEVDKYK